MKSRMPDGSASPQFVVQFPHPGYEHNPGNARRQPWNTGDHRRKFLCNPGHYVSEDGSLAAGSLVFWGEWEAPSIPKHTWARKDPLPRFLQVPVWEYPTAGERRQNTDPWVFGDSFRYSNCGQLRRGRALQELTPGSIVLFGSTIGPEFVIDTVFVVKDSCRFSPSKPPDTDEAFRVCVVESLLTTGSGRKCVSRCLTPTACSVSLSRPRDLLMVELKPRNLPLTLLSVGFTTFVDDWSGVPLSSTAMRVSRNQRWGRRFRPEHRAAGE